MALADVLPRAFARRPVSILLAAAWAALAAQAHADTAAGDRTLAEVVVTDAQGGGASSEKTGAYTVRKSRASSGLELSLRETPQSVSVVTRTKMDDFKLDSVNDVLESTTGVTVERVETDRTYYTSRGFDITNFQVDGIGVPFVYGNLYGDLDTAIYDRVEVVRGANGLMSATGNPSATVNFVRKRPTLGFQGSATATVGSWNQRRLDADVSGALNEAGTLRARLVGAVSDRDSYLARYSLAKNVFYGVLEADLSDTTTLAFGHSIQDGYAKRPLWGALPLYYTDGTPTNYSRSTSTAADWSYWNNRTTTTFTELSQQLGESWQARFVLTHTVQTSSSKMFYVYGTPDRATGLGLYSYPSSYDSDSNQTIADLYASGKFTLGGRRHDLTLGVSWSRASLNDMSGYGVGIGTALPPLQGWNGSYPQPSFDAATDGSSFVDRRRSAYAAARFNLADDWKLIAGARSTSAQGSGASYGVSRQTSAHDVTPYVGLIYDLTSNVSAYVSYTDIFNPQSQIDSQGQPLKPLIGRSYEAGLKGELFDKKLNASLAVFKTKQHNAAEQAGYIGPKAYYRGVDANSQGYELDASGNITSRLQGSAGFTHLRITDDQGNDSRTYVPRNLLRLSTTYRLPFADQVKVGASVNWQGAIYRDQGSGIVTRQPGYALVNLMARYDVSRDVSVSANLYNVTNEKYLTSLYWDQAYYGAPINGSVSVTVKF